MITDPIITKYLEVSDFVRTFAHMKSKQIVEILKSRIVTAIVSSVIFFISCWCPAFEVIIYSSLQNDVVDGAVCLVWGWLGLLFCDICRWNIIWLANPIYIISMFLFVLLDSKTGQNIALILCLCSITMGLSFSLCSSILISESGSPSDVGTLYIGYYLWILSFVVLLIGMLLYRKRIS